jgi:DNA invertase Pin-like site-specific DNA recombinase
MNITCAIYARVSTRDKGQEVTNQLAALREFAAKQDWRVAEEFVDHESGSTSERPQFQRMFQAPSQRKFDVLLFWSLDRLSREGVFATLQHLNRLTSYGVGYRSFTEQYFDSCGVFKDTAVSILATIAKQERIRISERVKAGQSRERLQGKRIGRPKTEVSASEVARLRAEGLSFQAIAEQTNISVATAFNLLKKQVVA